LWRGRREIKLWRMRRRKEICGGGGGGGRGRERGKFVEEEKEEEEERNKIVEEEVCMYVINRIQKPTGINVNHLSFCQFALSFH